jgi:hypothetical protein
MDPGPCSGVVRKINLGPQTGTDESVSVGAWKSSVFLCAPCGEIFITIDRQDFVTSVVHEFSSATRLLFFRVAVLNSPPTVARVVGTLQPPWGSPFVSSESSGGLGEWASR